MTDAAESSPIVARLRELARARRVRVAFADVHDDRVRSACERLSADGLCTPVCIEDPSSSPHFEDIALRYYRALRDEGVTEVGAVALAAKPAWFVAGLVAAGAAEACVAGPLTSAQQLVLAALRALGPKNGLRGVGSSTLLFRGETAATLADAHVAETPDTDRLARTAKWACDLHRRVSGDPTLVAFLAAAETEAATAALAVFHRRWPGLEAGLAAADALMHDCERDPNVLVVPGRAAGAAALGLLARLGGFRVIGPVLHGVRGACVGVPPCGTTEDVVHAAALAAASASSP